MGELLVKKALAVRDRLARIRAALPARAEDVANDERLEAFICFHVFLLAQDIVDLAVHLVADRGLAVPSSQREAFETLRAAGVLGAETASAMAALASLRNRIAHRYGDVDPVRIVREAPTGLDAAQRFLDEVAAALPG